MTAISLRGRIVLILSVACFSRAEAQEAFPRLDPARCFPAIEAWATALGAECAWLRVPALREGPEAGTLRLPVVRVRARDPDGSPPLVYLHGGPGGQGIVRNARWIFELPIARHRDVVVYDQRGAGLSEPAVCPNVAAEIRSRWERATEEPEERWDVNARACVQALRASGIDPLAFSTPNNVLDLIDLRRALGYDRWDVYGVSYGGTLAQELMRHDPSALRAAVLAYSSTPGPTMQAESALAYQRGLERLFAACAAQPACGAAFPSLAEDFFRVYRELEDEPAQVAVPRSVLPQMRVRMDGDRYLRDARCHLSDPRRLSRLPLLIHELAGRALPDPGRGREAALAVLAQGCGPGGQLNPTFSLVLCASIQGEAYREAAQKVRRRVRDELKPLVSDNAGCAVWQEDAGPAPATEPLRSDVPTLLLTGEFDERAPTDLARRIAAALSHAWVVELPGESHGGAVAGCHADILFQFLADPTRGPDTGCVAEVPPLVFESGGRGSP